MKQSLLYFLAAALFAVATGLNFFNDGLNLKTGIGLVFVAALLAIGLQQRRLGR
jgi:hypothetical protein